MAQPTSKAALISLAAAGVAMVMNSMNKAPHPIADATPFEQGAAQGDIAGVVLITLAGAIFAIVGLRKIRNGKASGKWIALTGLIVNSLLMIVAVLAIIAIEKQIK